MAEQSDQILNTSSKSLNESPSKGPRRSKRGRHTSKTCNEPVHCENVTTNDNLSHQPVEAMNSGPSNKFQPAQESYCLPECKHKRLVLPLC